MEMDDGAIRTFIFVAVKGEQKLLLTFIFSYYSLR